MHGRYGPGRAWACMMRCTDSALAAWTCVKAPPAVMRLQQKSSIIVSSAEIDPDNDAALLL